MNIEAALKASPIYWVAATLVVAAGMTLAIDGHYAKASDVAKVEAKVAAAKEELKQEMVKHRNYTDAGFLKQRKASLQDRVFELEAKREEKNLNAVELRLLIQWRSELEDVNRELRTKQ